MWSKHMVSSPKVQYQSAGFPFVRMLMLVLTVLMCSAGLSGYSVLTHEEIVDLL